MKIHGNVKCDCGHTQKDHYHGSGQCHDRSHRSPGKCGCTWFYPNVNYIKEKQAEKKRNKVVKGPSVWDVIYRTGRKEGYAAGRKARK